MKTEKRVIKVKPKLNKKYSKEIKANGRTKTKYQDTGKTKEEEKI